jgi:hypothetical protein
MQNVTMETRVYSITHFHYQPSLSATYRTLIANQALIPSVELPPTDDHIVRLFSVEHKQSNRYRNQVNSGCGVTYQPVSTVLMEPQ